MSPQFRALRFQPRSRPLFDSSRVLEYAKIRTVLHSSVIEGELDVLGSEKRGIVKGSDRTANHSRSSHNVANNPNIILLYIACSRLSDRGEDAKVKGTRKVGGAEKSGKRKGQFPPVFFYVRAFSIQRT